MIAPAALPGFLEGIGVAVARAVAAWLGARGAAVAWPVALVPTPLAIIPCGAARPIERARLAAWLEAA